MDVWFYHLQRQPLEAVLPSLLEKCLKRGWRAFVHAEAARLDEIDTMLWGYAPESFLPHGLSGADQPILISSSNINENSAQVLVFTGAEVQLTPADACERAIVIFDGNDENRLSAARAQWSHLKGQGFALTYWQQGENGGWIKKA